MLARKVNAASFDANHRQNNDLTGHHCAFSTTPMADVGHNSLRAG
jgi:hypothetical protein